MLENPTNGPHTDSEARPVRFREVSNARVLHVIDGFYRDAVFCGTFEVAAGQDTDMPNADDRVLCNALWYGWAPANGLKIQVNGGGWKIESGYTGPVVAELARPS